jgi:hypothetical protein
MLRPRASLLRAHARTPASRACPCCAPCPPHAAAPPPAPPPPLAPPPPAAGAGEDEEKNIGSTFLEYRFNILEILVQHSVIVESTFLKCWFNIFEILVQ